MSITIYIIIISCIVSIAAFNNTKLMSQLIFDPYAVKHRNEWWRFVTSGLIHADYFHLLINMFVLFSFGMAVEYYYSTVFGHLSSFIFITLYTSSLFASSLSTYYRYRNSSTYRSLGASGAVSAVVFTSILFNPYSKIYLYAIIGLPGILLGIIYLAYSYYMSKQDNDHINHEAHLYGAIYGMLFTIVFRPYLFVNFIQQLINF